MLLCEQVVFRPTDKVPYPVHWDEETIRWIAAWSKEYAEGIPWSDYAHARLMDTVQFLVNQAREQAHG